MKISPQLIRQCKTEDRRSQKELYLQLLPYIRAVCRRYAIKQSDLNDILQETFFLIFTKLHQYKTISDHFKCIKSIQTVSGIIDDKGHLGDHLEVET